VHVYQGQPDPGRPRLVPGRPDGTGDSPLGHRRSAGGTAAAARRSPAAAASRQRAGRHPTATARAAAFSSTDALTLDRQRYLSLATYRRNGAEVRTAVWFAAAGGRLYVFTAGDSGKVKRLRHSPRVRVAPCDVRGRVHGDWRETTARVLSSRASIDRAHAALRAKYGWQMRVADALSRLAGRHHRRAWIEIELPGAADAPPQDDPACRSTFSRS
jgi:uncharacterized protein